MIIHIKNIKHVDVKNIFTLIKKIEIHPSLDIADHVLY